LLTQPEVRSESHVDALSTVTMPRFSFSGSLATYKVWVTGFSAESCGLTPTMTVLLCAADGELDEVAAPPEAVLHAPSST